MDLKINGIILASGFSRRMGCDKLLLLFNGKTIIENILDVVVKSSLNEIVLVYRDDIIKEKAEGKGILSVRNLLAENGMSESIKLAVENTSQCDGYMFFVGDQVFLNEALILRLIKVFELNSNSIIVPLYNGKRGNPVIFPAEFKGELLKLTGDKGGRILIDNNKPRVKYVNIEDEKLGRDIDTVEQYNEIIKD